MKRLKYMLAVILAVAAVYFFMTPMGALRLSVALSGKLTDAVLLKAQPAQEVGYPDDTGPRSVLYCITEHVPFYELTDGVGRNWEIKQFGPFYAAVYYGWA